MQIIKLPLLILPCCNLSYFSVRYLSDHSGFVAAGEFTELG